MVSIARLERLGELYGDRFLRRVFTDEERADCGERYESLAARWAAKEAVAKALGTGIGAARFLEIEVCRDTSGRPELVLSGDAARLAGVLGLSNWAVSLAHDGGMAIAFVVAQ